MRAPRRPQPSFFARTRDQNRGRRSVYTSPPGFGKTHPENHHDPQSGQPGRAHLPPLSGRALAAPRALLLFAGGSPCTPQLWGPRPAGCGCVSGGPPRGCAVRARQRPPGLPSRRARTPKSQPNRTSPPSGAHWANDATPGGYRAQVSARFARPSCVGHLPPAARRGTAQFAGAAAGARRRSGRLSGGLLCSASRLWPGCSLPFSRGRRPWVVPPLPLFLSGFFRRFAPSGFRGLCRFFRWFRGSPPFPPRGRGWAARLPVPRFSGPSFSPGAAGGAFSLWGCLVASFVLLLSWAAVSAAALDAGAAPASVGCAPVPGASGARFVVRPVFPSMALAGAFARWAAPAAGRAVVVRHAPGGWSVSVPCAPAPPAAVARRATARVIARGRAASAARAAARVAAAG